VPGSAIVFIALAVIAAALVIGAIVSRYKVASPAEAFVISGSGNRADKTSSRVILGGGGAFVLPIVQHLYRISL
jgi:flotillin